MTETNNSGFDSSADGLRFLLLAFTDLMGAQRAKLVPSEAIKDVMRQGASFAGAATWLDLSVEDPDVVARPDANAAIRLPWKPEVAWVPADCTMNDAPLPQCPRSTLQRIIDEATADGFAVKTGVEPEFFLIDADSRAIADRLDTAEKPCYDPQAMMRQYEVIASAVEHMAQLGWRPYQADHEDGRGQFEVNWSYSDPLQTADRLTFFKFMIKSLAEQHGLRATFMPKPFPELTGSGMHIHISLWDRSETKNLFLDPQGELGLSDTARHFIGGILDHAPALTALTNPVVNSFKRLNAETSSSGATFAPHHASWSGNNRLHMLRVPAPGRIELRLPDAAANPYLLNAAVIAAGLDGVRRRLDPGPHCAVGQQPPSSAASLPASLPEALAALEDDKRLTQLLGPAFCASYLKLKQAEWRSFLAHFSQWEWDNSIAI